MKRLVLVLLLSLVAVFAISAQEISVEEVTGVVKVEVTPGNWEMITAETALRMNSRINTGLNSSLVLNLNGELVTLKAMQKGTVEELAAASQQSGGITLGGSLNKGSLDISGGQGRSNISTASTRASDAKEDLEWADEDE